MVKRVQITIAELLGYDLSIYVDPKTSDRENNAGLYF